MKKIYLSGLFILLILIVACTPSQNQETDKLDAEAIHNEAIKDSIATPGESKNVEIFDNLNKSLTKSSTVEYTSGVNGYLSMPVREGSYPAVILIHEWWGLNDNIKTMTDLLSQEGYVVLAIDLYDGQVATTSQKAGELATAVRSNPANANENMKSAVEYLRSLDNVKKDKVASLGWCFGGGQSLNLALSGEDMAATVIYYGSLVDDKEQLSKITWPVLGVFGEKDTSIPVESVNIFKDNLDSLGIDNEIYVYPGVGHAFANPSGANYAKDATKDAWEKTLIFLNKSLKN